MKIQTKTAVLGMALGIAGTLAVGRLLRAPVSAAGPPLVAAAGAKRFDLGSAQEGAASGRRFIEQLQAHLAATRSDRDRLAAELGQKNGVTVANLGERLATIKRSAGLLMGVPGDLSAAINDVRGLGSEGLQQVRAMLHSDDPADRILAAHLLGSLDSAEAVGSLLEQAVSDPNRIAALSASRALAMMDDPGAVEALREVADRKTTVEAEINALFGLAKHGDPQGIERALTFITDPRLEVSARAALAANVMMLPSDTVMPLVDATVKQFANVPQLTTVAVEYYKGLGTPAARDRLLALAADSNSCVACRTAARNALGTSQ